MTSTPHPEVEAYIQELKKWKEETLLLRALLLAAGLSEDWKWRQPCYTFQWENLIIIGNFKDSIVLSFLKGALLSDPHGWLERPGEHTQSGRFLRFTGTEQIRERSTQITAYIREAIEHANKFTARILDGKGMNDCTCGLSRKMPGCDGSHKLMRSAV